MQRSNPLAAPLPSDYPSLMASMPVRPMPEPAPSSTREGDVRRPSDDQVRRSHRERVSASVAWALDEYAETLAKLAK